MRVIQVPFSFYPDPVGGTEVYVAALASQLQKQGLEVIVAAPGGISQSYSYNGLPIHRFAISNQLEDLRQLYGEGDRVAAQAFSQMLDQEKPDLLHLHAFTSAVSLLLVREAKQRQIPVVFTYHTPTVSCQRGTLMQWGTQVCDGKLDLETCSQCTLHSLGLNRWSADILGQLPIAIGRSLGRLNLRGKAWTTLRMTELVALRQATFCNLMFEVDHIIAVCDWVREVLIRNGVAAERIAVIRQGLCHPVTATLPASSSEEGSDQPLQLVLLGRLDPIKGMHILIQAIRSLPELPIHLDIYAIAQGTASLTYQQQLVDLIGSDRRVTLKPPLLAHQVIPTLATYDLLAVPSQCLETGPLVILEAFASGVPVIGSNLGGIKELVHPGVDGVLVEATSVDAWSEALRNLCQNREQLVQLRRGIHPPETMETVSARVSTLYQSLL